MKSMVTLQKVAEKDTAALSQLLHEYQRELLPYTGADPEEIKTYKYLPNYFTDADRAAFFIMVEGKIGGFVLVNQHTILPGPAHSIAEFYVAPTFREKGVGEQAAILAFAKFPGDWEVAQMDTNTPAIRFWRKVVSKATGDNYKETILATEAWHGPVQQFRLP